MTSHAFGIVAVIGIMIAPLSDGSKAATTETDARAVDAVDTFMTFCALSLGSPVVAHHLLDNNAQIARPLDSNGLSPFVGPSAEPREGWIYKSPHDAWLVIAYSHAGRVCEVMVREADAITLKSQLKQAVERYTETAKAKLDTKPPERSVMEDVPYEKLGWEISIPPDNRVAILASVGDHPFGNKQALMTFALEH